MLRSWVVQQAVYARIAGDTALIMGSLSGVFDHVPQNQPMPYVVIGENTAANDDLLQETGSQEALTIHIWDKAAGFMRTKQIMERLYTLFHRATFALDGTQMVESVVEFTETFRDPDGVTRHGVLRLRIVTFG